MQDGRAAKLRSRADHVTHDTPVGCVYMMDYDAEQGEHHRKSRADDSAAARWCCWAILVLCSVVFLHDRLEAHAEDPDSPCALCARANTATRSRCAASDEYATLATEFNKLTDQPAGIGGRPQRQFVSDASHELKTPLASIKLLSDSILQNEMDADTMREFVADIGKESDRLTRMAQKLLTLSRAGRRTEGRRA